MNHLDRRSVICISEILARNGEAMAKRWLVPLSGCGS